MKNLTKIFVAVAALVAVSCTTDVTEDLGVVADGQTEFVLSLEQSRVQLGEKAGEIYPLYWSEGDKISVNGVASSELSVSGNSAVATFTVSGVSTPYCIAYPAANAGEVVFAAEQSYVEGTFSNGASTMYGYSENGGGVSLNHLTGVLKIGVTGDKTLSYAQISNINRAPIAGAFALDFTNGELSATEASKELIGYSFGEGVALSAEPTYIHVAVPAGAYNELYVTLYDIEGGVMYATVKANDEKPLAAGKVREFSNTIVYAPNSSVSVVKDAETLKAFAAQAAEADKDVLFVADVDMTGEEWTPIEGYAKNVLGNGYAIKGLTAPLFGTTSASIKGLHLKDVVLNSNSAAHYGALACEVVIANDKTPVIEHCSAQGTLTVENKEYAPVDGTAAKMKYANDDTKASEMAYGGLVGITYGAEFVDCVNNVAITVLQIAKDGDTTDVVPAIGGIVGNGFYGTNSAGKVFTNFTGCVNNGAILYKDNSCSTEKYEVYPTLGGIAGGIYHATGITKGTKTTSVSFTNCTNYGAITHQSVSGGQGQDTQGYPQTQIGGIIGRGAYMTATNCKNYGKLTVKGNAHQLHMAGCFGTSYYSNIYDCHNFGEVLVTETASFRGITLAGITGLNYSTADYLFETVKVSNNAPVSCLASEEANAPSGGTWHYRIGGVEGFGRSFASDYTNNKAGVVTAKGKVSCRVKTSMFSQVSGVCAYRTTCSWNTIKNYGDIIVDLDYTIHSGTEDDATTLTDRTFFIGGVTGYSSQVPAKSENRGNISVSGSFAGEHLAVGGIAAWASVQECANYGTITIEEDCACSSKLYVGGCVAGNAATNERLDVANYGKINVGGSHTNNVVIGGIAAQNRTGSKGWENHGDITVTAYSTKAIDVAGITGYFTNYYMKKNSDDTYSVVNEGSNGPMYESKNYGNFYIKTPNSTGSTMNLGGICKQGQHSMIGCVNNGHAYVTGDIGSTLYWGGVVTANSACLREDCVNNGDITVSGHVGKTTAGADCFLGGICYSGGSNTTYRRCVNNGDIILTETCQVAQCIRLAGIIPNVETSGKTNIFEECVNNGDIIVKGKSNCGTDGAGVVRIGGLFGQFTNGTVNIINGFKNTGDIIFSGNHAKDIGLSIGGIVGGMDGSSAVWSTESTGNIINEGEVKFDGTSKGAVYMGGFAAFLNASVPASPVKIINTGNITCTGTAKSYTNATISGICGNIKSPIANAQCFCDILAPGYGEAEIGMISGKVRSEAVTYTNVKVGGRICTEVDEEDESKKWITLSESNYLGLIYKMSGTPLTEEQATADGITIITSKDQIDYTTLPVPTPEAGTEE